MVEEHVGAGGGHAQVFAIGVVGLLKSPLDLLGRERRRPRRRPVACTPSATEPLMGVTSGVLGLLLDELVRVAALARRGNCSVERRAVRDHAGTSLTHVQMEMTAERSTLPFSMSSNHSRERRLSSCMFVCRRTSPTSGSL
jgi:hypothetical protein